MSDFVALFAHCQDSFVILLFGGFFHKVTCSCSSVACGRDRNGGIGGLSSHISVCISVC